MNKKKTETENVTMKGRARYERLGRTKNNENKAVRIKIPINKGHRAKGKRELTEFHTIPRSREVVLPLTG